MGTLKEVKEVFTNIREREERLDLVSLHAMSDLAVYLTGDVAHAFHWY